MMDPFELILQMSQFAQNDDELISMLSQMAPPPPMDYRPQLALPGGMVAQQPPMQGQPGPQMLSGQMNKMLALQKGPGQTRSEYQTNHPMIGGQ